MDLSEYLYYCDLISYIGENDDSEEAKILLTKTKYHLRKLRSLIDHDKHLGEVKSQLISYQLNSSDRINKKTPVKVPSTVYKLEDNNVENSNINLLSLI